VPPDEVLRALDDLVRSGKVRYVGTSTFPAWKVMEYLSESRVLGLVRPISEQPPYNLLDRRIENELVPLALAHGLAIIPWSPLAQGVVAGRYPSGDRFAPESRAALGKDVWNQRINDAGRRVGDRLVSYAAERGVNPAELALAWVRDQPGITAPIVGPRTMEHLDRALASAEVVPGQEDRDFLDSLVPPGTAVSDFHNNSGWSLTRVGWQPASLSPQG
jgi:aryl-alcohol dehydrogenase-like predicted oxidoreductase